MTPRLGTDGSRIVYPVRGIVQGARDIGRHPQRRTIAYVATLLLAAVIVAVSLVPLIVLSRRIARAGATHVQDDGRIGVAPA